MTNKWVKRTISPLQESQCVTRRQVALTYSFSARGSKTPGPGQSLLQPHDSGHGEAQSGGLASDQGRALGGGATSPSQVEDQAGEVTGLKLQGQARVGIQMGSWAACRFLDPAVRFNDHLHEATCLTMSTEGGKPAQVPGVATGLPWARCDCPGASAGSGAFPCALGNRRAKVPSSLWVFHTHLAPHSGFGEQAWLLTVDSRACLPPASGSLTPTVGLLPADAGAAEPGSHLYRLFSERSAPGLEGQSPFSCQPRRSSGAELPLDLGGPA